MSLVMMEGPIPNPVGSYLIPIPTVMNAWVEHVHLWFVVLHIMCTTIVVDEIGKTFQANLTTKFLVLCDNYYLAVDQFVSGKLDFLRMSVRQLNFGSSNIILSTLEFHIITTQSTFFVSVST